MDPLFCCVNYSCAFAYPTMAEWPAFDLVVSISMKQCDCDQSISTSPILGLHYFYLGAPWSGQDHWLSGNLTIQTACLFLHQYSVNQNSHVHCISMK